jgi:hypothetical protein
MIDKSDVIRESEPGRSSKYNSTPEDHLKHLLNMGWLPESNLIQKYIHKHGLQLPNDQT